MKMVKLSEFVLNPDNPQKWTDAAMADLVQSVRAEERTLDVNKIAYCTDYVSPISGESYAGQKVVIAGNKRLMALRKIHGNDGEVSASYFYDLTPLGVESRRRWLVRSNVQTGEWDAELLSKLYSTDELKSYMSPAAINDLFAAIDAESAKKERGKKDADDVPDAPQDKPVSRRGGGVRAWPSSAHVRRFDVRRGRSAAHGRKESGSPNHRSAV